MEEGEGSGNWEFGTSNTQIARDKDKITSRLMFIDFCGSVNVAPRHTPSHGRGENGRLADKENQRAFPMA